MTLKKMDLFATPDDAEALVAYVESLSAGERQAALVVMGMTWNLCAKLTEEYNGDLLHAAEEALDALTRNHNDEVQGDWNLADGYGLDDEVLWLTEAIAKAKGG